MTTSQTPIAEEVDLSGCNLELLYVAPSSPRQSTTAAEPAIDTHADALPVDVDGDEDSDGDAGEAGGGDSSSDQGDDGVA